MIVWIFIATLSNYSPPINMFNSQYAFTTKEACELAIKDLKSLKCIPLTVIDIPNGNSL